MMIVLLKNFRFCSKAKYRETMLLKCESLKKLRGGSSQKRCEVLENSGESFTPLKTNGCFLSPKGLQTSDFFVLGELENRRSISQVCSSLVSEAKTRKMLYMTFYNIYLCSPLIGLICHPVSTHTKW